jgi:hypothetical protein
MLTRFKATTKKTRLKSHQPKLVVAIRVLYVLSLVLFIAIAILCLCSRLMGGCRYGPFPLDTAAFRLAAGVVLEPAIQVSSPSQNLEPRNGSEFYACGVRSDATKKMSSRVNLLNYNRCVAQAMITALNAEEEEGGKKTSLAMLHAKAVFDDLRQFVTEPLKKAMSEFITGKSWIETNIDNIFSEPEKYRPVLESHVHAGRVSNIVIDQKVFPHAIPVSDIASYPYGQLTSTKGKYIAGYSGIVVNDMTFEFVPISPGYKPHLIAIDDFDKGIAENIDAPPNAFEVREMRDSNLGGMAAVVIGEKIRGQKMDHVFAASIPGGYIELQKLMIGEDKRLMVPDAKTFEKLLQRCREIQPSTTVLKLRELFRNKLSRNGMDYIYLPGQDPDRDLIVSDQRPITFTGAEPDGKMSPATRESNWSSGFWTPSTGYGNLLGRLLF